MRNYIKIPQFVKQIVGFIYIYTKQNAVYTLSDANGILAFKLIPNS